MANLKVISFNVFNKLFDFDGNIFEVLFMRIFYEMRKSVDNNIIQFLKWEKNAPRSLLLTGVRSSVEETPRGPTLRGGFRGKCSEELPASGVLLRGAFRASEQEPFFSQEPLALGAPLPVVVSYTDKSASCASLRKEKFSW